MSNSDTELNSLLLPSRPQDTRVVVAMSGGVDSSVVAAILKNDGYDVIGITLQLYDHGEAVERKGACCAGQDIHDARRVAADLSIPHYVLDYEERFASSVMDEFAESYISGETPIPCVTCNQQIKFNNLLETAKELGADVLATGHYIRSKFGENGWELHRAADLERDQSYFLFATTREQLKFLRFPLGDLHKSETRKLAQKCGLDVAYKSDSQDICFVPAGRYTQVIERLRPDAAKSGDIVHVDGRLLGQHNGIINYTIGQRRGIGIAATEALYVIRLDAEHNKVIVGPREFLRATWIEVRNMNWIGEGRLEDIPPEGIRVGAKIRSAQLPLPATLFWDEGKVLVNLHDGEEGVSPGQACVIYKDNNEFSRVLGGGWISSAKNARNRTSELLSGSENAIQVEPEAAAG